MAGYFKTLALAKNTGDHNRLLNPFVTRCIVDFKNIPLIFMVTAQ